MQVFQLEDQPPSDEHPLVLAIGKFDGVHIGHQAILREAKRHLDKAALAVMSFWPHPAWVLGGKAGYDRSLTPGSEKARVLSQQGVDRLYQIRFSKAYAATSAQDFVQNHLGALNLQRVVVGFDFQFGQGGTADVGVLTELCAAIGVPVSVVAAVEENGTKVSSSQVRLHLMHGRVEAAEALLGRPYSVVGTVRPGNQLGSKIGFPTANLGTVDEYVLPASGVYAVSVEICDDENSVTRNWFGVLNAGVRPTVDGKTFVLEVHLFGFSGNLYGQTLRVSFLRRIRDEMKFPSVTELTQQIERDVAQVKNMLGLS